MSNRPMRAVLAVYVAVQTLAGAVPRSTDQRGEGVISVAVAVLIIALLGVVAYAAFKVIFDNAANTATEKINQIGG
jgi:hypothetical protein